MYNPKDIQFAGKHDYDKDRALLFAENTMFETFSVGIFQWVLKNSGKEMKKSKAIVRVIGSTKNQDEVFTICESVVIHLDAGLWDGRKTVNLV